MCYSHLLPVTYTIGFFLAREVRTIAIWGVLPYKIPGKSQSNNQNAAKNQRIKPHLNPTHPIPLQNEIKTIKIPG